jgi:hypothetical protein
MGYPGQLEFFLGIFWNIIGLSWGKFGLSWNIFGPFRILCNDFEVILGVVVTKTGYLGELGSIFGTLVEQHWHVLGLCRAILDCLGSIL